MNDRPDSLPLEDPRKALAAAVALRRNADQLERMAVRSALAEGWTWAMIANELGVTRQAAHKRYRHLSPTGTRSSK